MQVITMDSYQYPNDNMLTSWVKGFKCQAALGLEFGAPIGHNFAQRECSDSN